MKNKFSFFTALLTCAVSQVYGQLPTLLADLNPAGNSNPGTFVLANNKLFFRAQDGTHGFELFVTDGTAAGTMMVKDINPGSASSLPDFMAAYNGKIYFQANDGTNGPELWSSDGTDAGTQMVKDIYPGSSGSSPYWPTEFNGKLYFQATDAVNGQVLYVTDGTAAGTMPVTPVLGGASVQIVFNNLLFTPSGDPTHGGELWLTDGTAGGTMMLKDINPGVGSSNANSLAVCNNKLFFSAMDGTNGYELWMSNGTAAGTTMVIDINPGANSSYPGNFTAYNGLTYFTADDGTHGRELWVTDGTGPGTHIVKDINPGAGNVNLGSLLGIAALGNKLYFGATNVDGGAQLWVTDGTASGTTMVKNISPYASGGVPPLDLHDYHNKLYFFATDSLNGIELWVSDGTDTGTKILLPTGATHANPISLTPIPGALKEYNENLYWAGWYDTHGQEMYTLTTPTPSNVANVAGDKNELILYPNPAGDEITVKITSGQHKQLQILNGAGQVVIEQAIHGSETKVNVKALFSGIYSIVLSGDSITETRKFEKL